MNRRNFLAMVAAAPMAAYIPVGRKSYFFAPKWGWQPERRIQLIDNLGGVCSEAPFYMHQAIHGVIRNKLTTFPTLTKTIFPCSFRVVDHTGNPVVILPGLPFEGPITAPRVVLPTDTVHIAEGGIRVTFS